MYIYIYIYVYVVQTLQEIKNTTKQKPPQKETTRKSDNDDNTPRIYIHIHVYIYDDKQAGKSNILGFHGVQQRVYKIKNAQNVRRSL